MPQPNDLGRSLVALDQNRTIIAVVELSQSSWLVAGMLPGIERQPRNKLEPSPESQLRTRSNRHRSSDRNPAQERTGTPFQTLFRNPLFR
jgi:transposase